jgi:hypothetical protein
MLASARRVKTSEKILFPVLIGILLALGAGVFSHYSTNCGGNSAALVQVTEIAIVARLGTFDTPDHSFRFSTANAEQREQLSYLSRTHWLHGARFLVSTAPVSKHEAEPRRIIVVCDTPYRNVPRQWIGSAPPTHAVSFADGSKGLISVAEFAALDHSALVPLDELYPSNPK